MSKASDSFSTSKRTIARPSALAKASVTDCGSVDLPTSVSIFTSQT